MVQYLGLNIVSVAARKGSKNLSKFVDKYNVRSSYDSWSNMIKNENLDAIIITASWDAIEKIIIPVLKMKIPCFVEKPLALSSNMIKQIKHELEKNNTKIQIGYNRRFYNYNHEIINYIKKHPIRSVIVEIPELFNPKIHLNSKNLWFNNSTHILDLMLFYFGEFRIHQSIKETFNNSNHFDTFNLLLSTTKNIPIHLIANWNIPSNFSITINFNNSIIKLSPIEYGCLYKGYDIIEPSSDNPIRKYKPKIIKEFFSISTHDSFKPGFLNQLKYFFNLMNKNEMNKYKSTTINDILFFSEFIESIYKFKLYEKQ